MTTWEARGRAWPPCSVAALTVIGLWLVSGAAHARDTYPGELQEATGTECPAPCTMCHVLPTGGKNWNPFGLRLVPPVLNKMSWPDIIELLRQKDVDTDGDGRLDVYEVEHGTSPVKATSDVIDCPRYGCGASVAAHEPDLPASLAGVIALGALLGAIRLRSRPTARSRR